MKKHALFLILFAAFAVSAFCQGTEAVKVYSSGTDKGKFVDPNIVTANSGTGADQFANGATTLFTQSGSGAVTRTVLNRLTDTVSVKDFGAVGDSTTDDTAAFQAALDTGKNVFVPNSASPASPSLFYKISDSLKIRNWGQKITGESPWMAIIYQSTGTAHGIEMIRPSYSGSFSHSIPNAYHNVVENLRIVGLGKAISTGRAISISDVAGSYPGHDGDWNQVRNCTIEGFDRGIFIEDNGQAWIEMARISQTNVGITVNASSANSHKFMGVSVANSGTGMLLSSGKGGVVMPDDMVMNSTDIVVSGGSWTIIGGNFESYSTRGIDVTAGSATIANAAFSVVGSGTANAPVRVATKAVLVGVSAGGMASSVPMVEKTATTAAVEVYGNGVESSNYYGTSANVNQLSDNGQLVWVSPFQQRYHTATAITPSANLRGRFLDVIGQSGSAPDALRRFRMRRDGTYVLDYLTALSLWETVSITGTSWSAANNVSYRTSNAALATGTLPLTSTLDDRITILGSGSGGWRIAQNAGQTISIGSSVATTGTAGYLQSTGQYDSVTLQCTAVTSGTGTAWRAIEWRGAPVTDTGGPSLAISGTIAVPADAVTPVTWMPMVISGTTFKVPLFQ